MEVPDYVKTQKMVDDYLSFLMGKNIVENHAFTVVFEHGTLVMVDEVLPEGAKFDVGDYVDVLMQAVNVQTDIGAIINEAKAYFEHLMSVDRRYATAVFKLLKGPTENAAGSGNGYQMLSRGTEMRKYNACRDFIYLGSTTDGSRALLDCFKPRIIGHITPKKEFILTHH